MTVLDPRPPVAAVEGVTYVAADLTAFDPAWLRPLQEGPVDAVIHLAAGPENKGGNGGGGGGGFL